MPFDERIKQIQYNCDLMGHDVGPIDGWWGQRTNAGVQSLQDHNGRPLVKVTSGAGKPPWIEELDTVWGYHENRDNAKLRAWLRSDGMTLGDPAQLPWCGDGVETAIKNSLPAEPFEGAVGENPYWARNWIGFGRKCPAIRYCIGVFSRGSGGHVGFIVSEDADEYGVYGTNQSNAVNVVAIKKNRLLATRWPMTYAMTSMPLAKLSGLPKSTNEF
jgi:hypothetical protein